MVRLTIQGLGVQGLGGTLTFTSTMLISNLPIAVSDGNSADEKLVTVGGAAQPNVVHQSVVSVTGNGNAFGNMGVTVMGNGNHIGGQRIVQNTGVMNISGNGVGNVIGNVTTVHHGPSYTAHGPGAMASVTGTVHQTFGPDGSFTRTVVGNVPAAAAALPTSFTIPPAWGHILDVTVRGNVSVTVGNDVQLMSLEMQNQSIVNVGPQARLTHLHLQMRDNSVCIFGGSVANLTAVLSERASAQLESSDAGRVTVTLHGNASFGGLLVTESATVFMTDGSNCFIKTDQHRAKPAICKRVAAGCTFTME
jgi:hypothetical protein